jgi:hypothetical protein
MRMVHVERWIENDGRAWLAWSREHWRGLAAGLLGLILLARITLRSERAPEAPALEQASAAETPAKRGIKLSQVMSEKELQQLRDVQLVKLSVSPRPDTYGLLTAILAERVNSGRSYPQALALGSREFKRTDRWADLIGDALNAQGRVYEGFGLKWDRAVLFVREDTANINSLELELQQSGGPGDGSTKWTLQGQCLTLFRDGTLIERRYADGKLSGPETAFAAGMLPRSQNNWRFGKRDGLQRSWNDAGELSSAEIFKDGVKIRDLPRDTSLLDAYTWLPE